LSLQGAPTSAGVPEIRFHDLRHTAASLSIRRGDSVKVVADRLGHTVVAFMINTYVHLFAEQRREGAFGIADLHEDGDEASDPSSEDEDGELPSSSEDSEAQDE
jgi:Phage integrase family